jgi:hypothetical protein
MLKFFLLKFFDHAFLTSQFLLHLLSHIVLMRMSVVSFLLSSLQTSSFLEISELFCRHRFLDHQSLLSSLFQNPPSGWRRCKSPLRFLRVCCTCGGTWSLTGPTPLSYRTQLTRIYGCSRRHTKFRIQGNCWTTRLIFQKPFVLFVVLRHLPASCC